MVARKTSTLPTKIWSSAAKCPAVSLEKRDEILSRAHAYTHRLILIEQSRLTEYRATRKHYAPEIEELQDALQDALAWRDEDAKQQAIDSARGALRTAIAKFEADQCGAARAEYAKRRAAACAGMGPAIKARLNNEILVAMLAEDTWPDSWKDLAMADRDSQDQVKRARSECGLTKGCYLAVENAVNAAIKDSRPLAPQLPPWDGSGRIAVQIENNNRWADIVAGRNRFLRVEYTDDRPLGSCGNSSIRCWAVFIRVGSNSDRTPVWLEFSARLHRHPPDDAIVKWAWIKCYKSAGREQHRFQLTFEHESLRWLPKPGAVGSLDLQCCHEPVAAGVRVARWCGSDGLSGEVVVPDDVLGNFRFAHGIRSALDGVRAHGYRVVRKWLALGGNHVTGWRRLSKDWRRAQMLAVCQSYVDFHETKSPNDSYLPLHRSMLTRDVSAAQDRRFALWLDSWLRKERHLWRYWRDSEARAVNLRNTLFLQAAHELRRKYVSLSSDTSHLIANPKMSQTERASRQAVAPGECRAIFREAFGLSRAPGSRGTSKAPKKRRRSQSGA